MQAKYEGDPSMIYRLSVLCLLFAAPAWSNSEVETLRSEVSQLKELVMMLEQRLQAVEGQRVEIEDLSALAKANPVSVKSNNNAKVSLASDFRLRYESIDKQGADRRERERLRARATLTYKGDDFTGVLGLASGGDSPTSTNQTFGSGGSTKDLQLDLAYVIYPLSETVNITAGKMKNPLYRPGKFGLVWDSDYRPEGVFVGYEDSGLALTAGGFWLESDTKNANERAVYAVQGRYQTSLDSTKLTLGAGYFEANIAGDSPFYSGDTIKLGNLQDCLGAGCVYANDYHVIEAFAEVALANDISAFAHWIENSKADSNNQGYVLGVNYGRKKQAGDWAAQLAYQSLENEATMALLTDSDFAGGGTGGEGAQITLSYQVSKAFAVNLLYAHTERTTYTDALPLDYERLVLDFSMKY